MVCHSRRVEKRFGIDWKNILFVEGNMPTRIEMAGSPFAEGALRYTFYTRDIIDD